MKLRSFIVALSGALLCVLLAASPAGSGSMLLLGAGKPAAGGVCTNLVTIDGSASVTGSGPSTTHNITITTTNANDLIIIAIQSNASVVNSVSDVAGLTWTQLGVRTGTMTVYSAFSTGALTSDVVTVTYSSDPAFDSIVIWGLNGVPTSNQFDSNGALPGTTTTSTPLTLTTSNACDFLFAAYSDNSGTVTAGSGWTLVPTSGGNFMGVEYKLVTTTQAALSATVGGSTIIKNGLGHAVKSQ